MHHVIILYVSTAAVLGYEKLCTFIISYMLFIPAVDNIVVHFRMLHEKKKGTTLTLSLCCADVVNRYTIN